MVRIPTAVVVAAVLLAQASPALAQDPGTLGELVTETYSFALSIVGLCVFVMFLYAGVQLIMGNRQQAQKAATDAVVGFVLLYSAYVILNSISPQFVKAP